MAEVPLTNGGVALVDDSDLNTVLLYKWYGKTNRRVRYAATNVRVGRCKYKTLYMHNLILKNPDHMNGNGLDNRRDNLRQASHAEQMRNRGTFRRSASGYKGVVRNKDNWAARICVDHKRISLGTRSSPEEAAKLYNAAAITYFGEFAKLNII